jgi:prepilin signal peptidase PulO-like enzyme (type II secretory pathway)
MSFFFFALGAIIASFVGVISVRLNTGQSFISGRSHCDACAAPLAPRALVPIFSYVLSGGRAHCCGARISLYSPLTELFLGGLFVLAYLKLDLTGALFFMLVSLSLLLALVLYDLAHQILPPTLLALFVGTSLITRLLIAHSLFVFLNAFLVAFLVALPLALIHIFSHGRYMGLSDTPLAFGLALLTGSTAFSGFIFSFWIGAVIGIILLARRPRGTRMRVEVPFAPFLAAGFILAYFTQWNPFFFVATVFGN